VALETSPEYWEFVALSPEFVPVRLATAAFASIALVIAPLAIAVSLPVEVTTPVRLALVVTVVASATPILAVQSKEVPPIVRAVVSFGADTIVMTGVVVVVATVASAFAEVTEVTVPGPPPAIKVGADVVPAPAILAFVTALFAIVRAVAPVASQV